MNELFYLFIYYFIINKLKKNIQFIISLILVRGIKDVFMCGLRCNVGCQYSLRFNFQLECTIEYFSNENFEM